MDVIKKAHSSGAKVTFLVYAIITVTKHNHLQLQSRILRRWFTVKFLLNIQHLNFTGRVILFDNPTSRVSKSSQIRWPNENIFAYTYSFTCQ